MSDVKQVEPLDVLSYWFGPDGEVDDLQSRLGLWYAANPQVDETLRRRFATTIDAAINQQCNHWADTTDGRLALIILLDQFTRNSFRGQAKAFAGDEIAYGVVKEGLDKGQDQGLAAYARMFFYMPLEHSESLADQRLSVEMFTRLNDECRETVYAEAANTWLQYAVDHAEIIERFGRYPHRNKALSRESTAAELEYLAADAPDFGQTS